MLQETDDCNLELPVTGWNAGEVVAVERVHKACIISTKLHFPRKRMLLESRCGVLKVYFSLIPRPSEIDFKIKTLMCLFLTTVCFTEKWYIKIHISLDSLTPGKETVYVTHWWKCGLLYSVRALGQFLFKWLENMWLFLICLSIFGFFMETVTFTVSAVWNTAFVIAFNDYFCLLT